MPTTSILSDLLLSDPFPIEDDSSVDVISSLSEIMTVKTTRIISNYIGNSVQNECLRVAARLVTSERPYDGNIRPQSPETRF